MPKIESFDILNEVCIPSKGQEEQKKTSIIRLEVNIELPFKGRC